MERIASSSNLRIEQEMKTVSELPLYYLYNLLRYRTRKLGKGRPKIPKESFTFASINLIRTLRKSTCVLPALELLPRESIRGVSIFLESNERRMIRMMRARNDKISAQVKRRASLTSSAFFPVSWNVTLRQVKSSRGFMPIKFAAVSISNNMSRSIFSSETKS
jgi:hypothetical protein